MVYYFVLIFCGYILPGDVFFRLTSAGKTGLINAVIIYTPFVVSLFMNEKLLRICGLSLFILFGCQKGKPVAESPPVPKENTEVAGSDKSDMGSKPDTTPKSINPYLVEHNQFYGIQLQDTIAILQEKYPALLQQDVKKTGEGDFDIYKILSEEGIHLANIYPNPQNEALVGQIEIITPLAVTKAGIKIGDSYATLLKKAGAVEVHGSEIEGRTYAAHQDIFYKLDMRHFTYALDPGTINPEVKILEITIM